MVRKQVIILTTAVGIIDQAAGFGMTQDFMHGFETGVFVRDDDMAFYEYSCEKPVGNKDLVIQA